MQEDYLKSKQYHLFIVLIVIVKKLNKILKIHMNFTLYLI